jgi:hypothetical protein
VSDIHKRIEKAAQELKREDLSWVM